MRERGGEENVCNHERDVNHNKAGPTERGKRKNRSAIVARDRLSDIQNLRDT